MASFTNVYVNIHFTYLSIYVACAIGLFENSILFLLSIDLSPTRMTYSKKHNGFV